MALFRKYYQKVIVEQALDQPSWGVAVINVGHNIHPPGVSYPDYQHPGDYVFDWDKGRILEEFQLVYISRGQGIFEADGVKPTMIEAGTAFLLFPGVWHRYRPSEQTGWEEFWVGFKGSYADYLMEQSCFQSDKPLIQIGFNSELLQVLTHLVDTVRFSSDSCGTLSSCLTIQVLALLYASAIMKNPEQSQRYQLILHAKFRIQEYEQSNMDLEELAKELNVSYVWFRKEFKRIVGTSPGQYHLSLRIKRARQLLSETDLSIGNISDQLGFDSDFHFSKIFKQKVGFSPANYRKNLLKSTITN
ncbi:AraC family transcriptional regulator [Dyadobacter sp. CY356]|uniref:AraC family transcriptional regulator n=1 Tax=Dyadobacter sp. CY356 TaxID=2906442 RepID=UPI001F27E529|nr:AraC family transcriptional regulator [Dyadobacter sp. CY356]MCF0055900.1 AraC family transcriptional regulator [Dyadobacter sp. CY356]